MVKDKGSLKVNLFFFSIRAWVCLEGHTMHIAYHLIVCTMQSMHLPRWPTIVSKMCSMQPNNAVLNTLFHNLMPHTWPSYSSLMNNKLQAFNKCYYLTKEQKDKYIGTQYWTEVCWITVTLHFQTFLTVSCTFLFVCLLRGQCWLTSRKIRNYLTTEILIKCVKRPGFIPPPNIYF